MIKALCIGAGGHAEILLEILHLRQEVEIIGLLDRDRLAPLAGIPVLGTDDQLEQIRRDGIHHAVIGVGGFGDSRARKQIATHLSTLGFTVLSVIHPSAIISPSAQLGEGLIALAGSIVGCAAAIGRHVILNTASSVDHHCTIGDFSHLAPGACLGGRVELGDAVHLGVGSCVRDGVKLGDGAIIGAGAAVVDDLPGHTLYVGVPARPIKSL